MKKFKALLTLALAALTALAAAPAYAAEPALQSGDYCQFGRYNGEPIIWRAVIDESDENGILMVTDDILCYKAFDPGCDRSSVDEDELNALGIISYAAFLRRIEGSNIWENSSIRTWLNSTANAGEIEWPGNAPSEENTRALNYHIIHPYDDEKGFLNEDNFTASELSVIKSVWQWNTLNADELDKATNGKTVTYLPFYEYQRGSEGMWREGGVTFDDCHEAYAQAAAHRVSDSLFLLNEVQLHSVYESLGTAAVAAQESNTFLRVTLRTPCSMYIGVMGYTDNGFYSLSPSADSEGYYGAIRPGFYLNEDTTIILSGSGTQEDPYILDGTAQDGITVFANGGQVEFDTDPVIEDGHTLVGMRAVFESLGADVNWDDDTQTVTAVKDDTTIELQIDNNVMIKNGETVEIDTPARMINDRTMIPLRAVSEALDASVEWIEELQRVVIDVQPEWTEYDWSPAWYKKARK